jgi:hypothetical protein
VLDGVAFKEVPAPPEVSVVPLPPARMPKYLFRLRDGRYIYVSADVHDYSFESFRLFIGDGKVMREIPVGHVRRYLDGGTTFVETAEETLFSPSGASSSEQIREMFDRDGKPTWGNEELERLDASQFVISESATGVTIDETTPEPEFTVRAAKELLRTWHKRSWNDGTIVWLKQPTDCDYAAIGEHRRSSYVQIWLLDRESIILTTMTPTPRLPQLMLDSRRVASGDAGQSAGSSAVGDLRADRAPIDLANRLCLEPVWMA